MNVIFWGLKIAHSELGTDPERDLEVLSLFNCLNMLFINGSIGVTNMFLIKQIMVAAFICIHLHCQ